MAMYSAQFNQVFVDDASGTLRELTDYARSIRGRCTWDDRDGTTMKAGGLAIAETHGRGALAMTIDVEWLYHRALAKHLRQIYGSITGFRVRVIKGSNAAPTFGDEVWQATMTFFSLPFAPTPGQDVRFRTVFSLVDGAPNPIITKY